MSKISQKIKSGLVWAFINQVVGQVIFVVFNIYLSRLLGPQSFGIIGMITVFSGFAVYFVDAGFGSAIVQKADITTSELSTVFWSNLFIGILLYLIFFFAAPFIAQMYKEPSLVLYT